MAENEISVTTEGVSIKGDVVDDLRPPIRRVARIADSVGRLLEVSIRLPADYLSHNLERVYVKYQERLQEIPLERRQEAPMRLGYAVVKHASESADEPDLQEMFANLLASASDSSKAAKAHPAFATVIGEMRALDAKVLIAIDERSDYRRGLEIESLRFDNVESGEVHVAVSNLVRLHLIDWQPRVYSEHEIRKLAGANDISVFRARDLNRLIENITDDVRKLKTDVIAQVQRQQHRRVLVMTEFGRNFVATAFASDAMPDQPK